MNLQVLQNIGSFGLLKFLHILLYAHIPPNHGGLLSNLYEEEISPEPLTATSRATVIDICHPEDILANKFCTCDTATGVVSCDFRDYKPTLPNNSGNDSSSSNSSSITTATEAEISLSGYHIPPKISRLCFCNTPNTLHLLFTLQEFLPHPDNKIQRVDLYNLRGVTKFHGGFGGNFHGELYISNVSLVQKLHGNEFARRDKDVEIRDLQNLKCCSPIQLSQQLEKPVLLIENTTIGFIQSMGLTNVHPWKTFIMKSVHVKGVEREGILFNDAPGYNVAILGTKFENVERTGLVFKDSLNLLMVNNYFKNTTNSYCMWSGSILNDSNILLMNNIFWNKLFVNVDAQNIASLFNIYNLWDNFTFSPMHLSSFSPEAEGYNGGAQRSISFRYNLVDEEKILENSLDFAGSRVFISENTLGTCNCSYLAMKRDKLIKADVNYCYTGVIAEDRNLTGECVIKTSEAIEECARNKENPATDFHQICSKRGTGPYPQFPGEGTSIANDIGEARIKSNFISQMVKEFHCYFESKKVKIGEVVLTEKEPTRDTRRVSSKDHPEVVKSSKNESHPVNHIKSAKKRSPAVPIFVSLLVLVFIIAAAGYGYKNRHRCIHGRNGHQSLDENQESLM